ncbi:MAG: tetratricopeptide repeat protein [Rhizobiaceae bacterium]
MAMKDSLGFDLTGATADALGHYERAQSELSRFVGDPVASADAAIAVAPDFVMAHAFKGWLFALATEKEATAAAKEFHAAAVKLGGNARERAHVAALGALVDGHWHAASQALEDLTIEYPNDLLALQSGHQIDFFTGNARMLRDRIARALPAWEQAMPGYHSVLGMQAFGLEETGDYGKAEAAGKRAIELEPRDGWAQHAVAHVMEMMSRQRDGIAWMRANPDAWTKESFFQVHNWWHLSLYHYDLGEIDEVLKLYDGPIYGAKSPLALNMVDAAALLWRLMLGGHDVGDRWQGIADNWAPKATSANYAFNDAHAMMSFIGAGRTGLADDLIAAQREALAEGGDNAAFTRDVGLPVVLGLKAFGDGDYAQAVQLLRPVRAVAHRFGGSHAQRDVIDLTLMEAALRGGDAALSAALASERFELRQQSPLSGIFVERAKRVADAAGGAGR